MNTKCEALQPRIGKVARLPLLLIAFIASNAVFAQQQIEVQISTDEISDFEFDWGRDGVTCETCNFGAGNNGLTFTDRRGRLWVGSVDVVTGEFQPPNGRDVLVDVNAAVATDFGNGPEWVTSADGSKIAFTRYLPGQPSTPDNAALALATASASGWLTEIVEGGEQRISPLGSLDVDDPEARLVYGDVSSGSVLWRYVSDPTSEAPVPEIVGTAGSSRRWVPGRQQLIYTMRPMSPLGIPGFQQVFIYDILEDETEQLTNELSTKWGAFMWSAPEFGGAYVMFALVDFDKLIVYRKMLDRRGRMRWKAINTITGTPTLPYIWSPEPFVHNGHSYITMQLSSSPNFKDFSVPTHIAIAGIETEHLDLQVLTDESEPPRVRIDPEYFITEQGPYIYYARYFPTTETTPLISDGVWRVDTGLGPPVQSSP